MNPHKITEEFEKAISVYTGSPFTIAVDSCSNAIFLCLAYLNGEETITIPSRTYPSIPCEIIHSGRKVIFENIKWKGHYKLKPLPVWDSALRFTSDMYMKGQYQCLSFTGPHKHLKLGKGGAILTDDYLANKWFRRARFSGRRNISYNEDHFDMLGWNFWMMPEIAARGLNLIQSMEVNEDVELFYPDLSNYEIYKSM
jgi:dTDP-4-amino-4,6-dideoxygalactose transaminase